MKKILGYFISFSLTPETAEKVLPALSARARKEISACLEGNLSRYKHFTSSRRKQCTVNRTTFTGIFSPQSYFTLLSLSSEERNCILNYILNKCLDSAEAERQKVENKFVA